MSKRTIHNIHPLVTDKRKLGHTLQSQVRVNEHKKRIVFDAIHILLEFDELSDEQAAQCLVSGAECENLKEALQWLRRYKEKLMAESDERYKEEQAQLSGEIEEIRKMENRE